MITILEATNSKLLLGTVIATSSSPTTQKLDFVLKNDRIVVLRGEFVEILDSHKSEKIILSRVGEIQKLNTYLSSADSVRNFGINRPIEGLFPTDEWNYVICSAKPLGSISGMDSRIEAVKFPVSPGSNVFRANPNIMSSFLGFSSSGLHLGQLKHQKVDIRPLLSRLLHKHLAILAISGAGKSYAATVLLEELILRESDLGRIATIIIDPHGEYRELYEENENPIHPNIQIERGSFFQIAVPYLSAWNFREFSPEMSIVQVRELNGILSKLREKSLPYGIGEISECVKEAESIGARTKESLLGWLYTLSNSRIFGYDENPPLDRILSPGKAIIFDLSDILSLMHKQIACSYISRRLFDLRRKRKVPPFLLMIEEAHQFCPEGISSISRSIIETIAREGRKFYASLCLISQRPVRLSTTALSQCNTHLILRIRNPYDIEFIGRISEGLDRDSLNVLPDLEIGTGLLVGEATNFPVQFQVRKRTLERKGRFSHSLEDEAKEFDNS